MQLETEIQTIRTITPQLPDRVSQLLAHIEKIRSEMDTLKQLGMTDAKPSYKDDVYLVLVHPMRNGDRRREYIGKDPLKKAEAMDRIKRYERYRELEIRLTTLQQRFDHLIYHMRQIISLTE